MKILIIQLILLHSCINTNAQVGISNTGILQINTGASVSSLANFTNSSSGSFINNGSLYVTGNITNDQSAMSAGTGTLYLNGSSTQAINGAQVFKTYNLITNNAAGITLNNNLSISGAHTYTSGMITTSSSPNYMIYEAGSSYTGINDSRHVNGWVKKLGNTDFVFPVGNATYERTVALTNLSAASEFDVKYNNAVTPNRFSVYNPLVIVDSAEYWTINKISGAAASVTMNWDNSKVAFPLLMLSDIRAAWYDGTFWTGIGGAASGSVLTSGSVTSNSVSAFNDNFVIGSNSFLLPLKIISFTAGRTNNYTKINWAISNELNVDHYELERSNDAISFNTISLQDPFNRNGTEFYSYDDRLVFNGTVYYRLKVIGNDNRVAYSNIVTVSDNNGNRDLYVVTNPVNTSIDIYAGAAVTGMYNYTIANTGGQVMQSGMIDIKHAGIHSIILRPVFSPGAYLLVIRNSGNELQKTIIKK